MQLFNKKSFLNIRNFVFYVYFIFSIDKADTDWYSGTRKVSTCDASKQTKINGKSLVVYAVHLCVLCCIVK